MELANPLLINGLALAAIISGLLVAAWFIVGLFWVHDRETESQLEQISAPAELCEAMAPVPPVLILFFVFSAIFMLLYVVYIWAGGISY